MKTDSEKLVGGAMEMSGEFQLLELEQRLEMAAAVETTAAVDYCCRCFMNPWCDMYEQIQ